MAYWVCETWQIQDHIAHIHKAECGHCKNGEFISSKKSVDYREKWHGPFKTLTEAKNAAQETGGRVKQHRCCLV